MNHEPTSQARLKLYTFCCCFFLIEERAQALLSIYCFLDHPRVHPPLLRCFYAPVHLTINILPDIDTLNVDHGGQHASSTPSLTTVCPGVEEEGFPRGGARGYKSTSLGSLMI